MKFEVKGPLSGLNSNRICKTSTKNIYLILFVRYPIYKLLGRLNEVTYMCTYVYALKFTSAERWKEVSRQRGKEGPSIAHCHAMLHCFVCICDTFEQCVLDFTIASSLSKASQLLLPKDFSNFDYQQILHCAVFKYSCTMRHECLVP